MRRTEGRNYGGGRAAADLAPTARKTSRDENFPVASLLLSRRLRPHVKAFYSFVRLADDIADDPALERDEKLAHLDALEAALCTGEGAADWRAPAADLHASLAATGITDRFARDLLEAFRRDAVNAPCRSWDDLIDYCRYSAMPVGRFLMALHGEDDAPGPASDALCTALQILNHLQDCGDDWRDLRRLYVPLDWLAAEGLDTDALLATHSSPALRRVLDRVLDAVDGLLATAAPLGRQMRDLRLGLESAAIVALARALRNQLRRRDPLAGRVELNRPIFLTVAAQGAIARLVGRG